jgi:hypothetical protein
MAQLFMGSNQGILPNMAQPFIGVTKVSLSYMAQLFIGIKQGMWLKLAQPFMSITKVSCHNCSWA